METVGIRSIRTQSALVAQNKRNLDDPGQAGSHQRVAKERMDHTADHQVLRMGGHGIPSQHDDDTRDQVTLGPAVALAAQIGSFSPDAIIVTRQGLREAWESPSVEQATSKVREEYIHRLREGENFKIGVGAFATKTKPKWVPSRL